MRRGNCIKKPRHEHGKAIDGPGRFHILKIDAPNPHRPSPRLAPRKTLHYLWLAKLTIPPSSQLLTDVTCTVFGDDIPFFTIACWDLLPDAGPTDYVWKLIDVNDAVQSISIVNSCDHRPDNIETTKAVRDFNGKLSFASPLRVYAHGDALSFAGSYNNFDIFQVQTRLPINVQRWKATYTGYRGTVDVLELSEDDARPT